MKDLDVVIVGAGLTGLRAALEVSRAGLSVLVVERTSDVGGRMRTSVIQGALVDNGFQVLLTGYPELQTLPPLTTLECGSFTAGARIRIDGGWCDIIDPRRHPAHFLRSMKRPLGSVADLLRFALCVQSAPWKDVASADISTADLVDAWGFSRRFSDGFLKPFLRGVLLDPTLTSDASLAKFYLRTFSRGSAALPAQGVQALPRLLADTLGRQHILLDSAVIEVLENRVVLEGGEDISARHVIVAGDALNSAALGGPVQTSPHCGTKTLYFLADSPPYPEPILVLDGDGTGPVNNLAVLSNVQPTYAPPGRALISASVIGGGIERKDSELVAAALHQLNSWFGPQVSRWEHIQTVSVPNALPARPRLSQGWIEKQGVFFAGDYLSYGSQNGALMAGRAVGQAVCGAFTDTR